MSIKKSIVFAVLVIMTLGVFIACGEEKKNKDGNGPVNEAEKVTEMVKETSKTEAEIEAAQKKTADSIRKVDSLRQVKEHGHAH